MNAGHPSDSPVLAYLRQLHKEFAGVTEGAVANYIPELAKANPNWFGICLVTTHGKVYEVGDTDQSFTIQSISKPLVYGLALEDNGRPQVQAKVGMEPTGDAFNSISLEAGTGRPRNPMINAGAIATAGLIAGKSAKGKFERILETLSRYAGRELVLDESVYRSESETGHRNRAIGYMLRNFNMLTEDPTPVVELYFRQCSISVTCRDLGVIAGTLANRGTNPVTGKQALRGEYVESVLSVMGSCGMYDAAGEWVYRIGMPAKSGVGGGIIAVLPGQLGVAVFSPPLDDKGNSVRGIRVCDALSRHCDLHMFNRPGIGKSAIRLRFTAAEFNSSRVRTAAESRALRENGESIVAYQLQGHLSFSSTEAVIADVMERVASTEQVILDFRRVLAVDESACRLLYEMLLDFANAGKPLLFTGIDRLPIIRRYMKTKLAGRFNELFHTHEENDPALEWCENHLLEKIMPQSLLNHQIQPDHYELLAHFSPDEIAAVSALFQHRSYLPGQTIISHGDDAHEMFFLARGRVSVLVPRPSDAQKRLATFSAGMAFGEMAFLDRAPRSAFIVADSDVECDVLKLDDFEQLSLQHPKIKIKLLENLALSLCGRLRKANRELSVFD